MVSLPVTLALSPLRFRPRRLPVLSPAVMLMTIALLGIACCAAAVRLALEASWLGLGLVPAADGQAVTVTHAAGPAAALPTPARVIGIWAEPHEGSAGGCTPCRSDVQAIDLTEDPSMLASYAAVERFFARQGELATILAQPRVTLRVQDATGLQHDVDLAARAARPLASLPLLFWVQLAAGLAGLLIGSWVWVLRPADWGARMFALTGVMMLVFTLPAAVYSTRELALAEPVFRLLSMVNMTGALLFGCALIAIFLCFPRQLVAPARLLWIPAVFGTWLLADMFQWWPFPMSGAGTLVETAAAMVCIALQWWVNRRDAHARAALRWLGVAAVVGAALFVVPQAAAPLVGELPPMPQGYGFVFFLIMYAGMALGVSRYRLFQLDEWAFRILVWVVGGLALLALDAVLIWGLHLAPSLSLGLALVIAGFLYLPLRGLLWTRLVARRRMSEEEVFRAVLDIALERRDAERAQRWQALLERLYEPLDVQLVHNESAEGDAQIAQDGLVMRVPPAAGAPALALHYPWQGRGLFGGVHLRLVQRLLALMRYADDSRADFARGAAEERQRITRDLHDDIGARLLSGLHTSSVPELRQTVRGALSDLRAILSDMTGQALPLSETLLALRNETTERLAAAGIEVEWRASEEPGASRHVGYATHKNLLSAQREVVSNILRHAGAVRVTVELQHCDGSLQVITTDHRAAPLPPLAGAARVGARLGLENIRQRLAAIGGDAVFQYGTSGACVRLSLPLPATGP